MDIQSIVAQLKQEASRIEHAIAALMGLGSQPVRRGRSRKISQTKPKSGPEASSYERGCSCRNRRCQEGLVGEAERQTRAQETCRRLQEDQGSYADECRCQEEAVGVDEGALGGEKLWADNGPIIKNHVAPIAAAVDGAVAGSLTRVECGAFSRPRNAKGPLSTD